MKYFNLYSFFGLFCVLHVFDGAFCTDSIYEQISPYMEDSHIVDPDSLYYNRQMQKVTAPKDDHTSEVSIRGEDSYQSYCRDSPYEVFARRLINILVAKANIKVTEGLAFGHIDIEATVEELEVLKHFGKGKVSIRQIDSIITNVIRQTQTSYLDEALNITDRVSIYIYQHRVIFGAILLFIFVIMIALKVKWTRWRIIFLIFDIVIIISFMLTWWELLQESEIQLAAMQKMYGTMPNDCSFDKIGFVRSIVLFFGWDGNNCMKHYEAVMTDPVLKVTPLQAFSHMCSKFFIPPLTMAGSGLSAFIENITEPLPYGIKIIAKIFLVMSIPSLIAILAFISLGGAMGLRLGPFFHLYLHGRQSTPPSNSLATGDRQAIEIIRSNIAEVVPVSATESQSSSPTKKESPKKIKGTQTEKTTQQVQLQNTDKQEESDTNSEEFSEEMEFENISRKKLEHEINQSSDKKISENLKRENKQKEDGSDKKDKKSLEIGSGDN